MLPPGCRPHLPNPYLWAQGAAMSWEETGMSVSGGGWVFAGHLRTIWKTAHKGLHLNSREKALCGYEHPTAVEPEAHTGKQFASGALDKQDWERNGLCWSLGFSKPVDQTALCVDHRGIFQHLAQLLGQTRYLYSSSLAMVTNPHKFSHLKQRRLSQSSVGPRSGNIMTKLKPSA